MGTPDFAVASLDALVASSHHVVAVVTSPDKPAGRGLQVQMSAVKKYALSKEIPILQPERLKDEKFLSDLKSFGADLFVIVAFRMLPEVVWQMPPLGSVNLHGSLLPKYRGAAPINRAVMNGEKVTGVTTFFLQQEIDTGSVIQRTEIPIGENETAGELHDRMMEIGAKTLVESVDQIATGFHSGISQTALIEKGETVIHAPKIFKEDCRIDWSRTAGEVHNFIRGLSPYPAAWTMLGDKTLKIYAGEKMLDKHIEHVFETDGKHHIWFKCGEGSYSVNELQLEGKKKMTTEEFLRGWRPSLSE